MPPAASRPPQHPLALPPTLSPDALDALPELALTLSRLRPPQSGANRGATPATVGGSASQGGGVTGTTPAAAAAATPSGAGGGAGAGGGYGGLSAVMGADISLKELPHATDALKHKLQRSRAQVKALPDMGRSIAEQEATIADLERLIRTQHEVLAGLRSIGVDFGTEVGDRMEM